MSINRQNRQALERQASLNALSQQQDRHARDRKYDTTDGISKGKSAAKEQPYDDHLRARLKELYPRRHRKVGVQLVAAEAAMSEEAGKSKQVHGVAGRAMSSQLSSAALTGPQTTFTATATDFRRLRPAEPVDAYTDSRNAKTVAHSELEEILAIPKDGRKLLHQHSQGPQRESDKSRNPLLKKLAAASSYSIGGKALSSYKEKHAPSTLMYRTSSAAQLLNQGLGLRADTLHSASTQQLQRLQVTRTAKELNQAQVANLKASVAKNGLARTAKPASGFTSSAKKSLPQLKGTLSSAPGLNLLAEDSTLKGSRSSMAVAQSKSSQVHQCASQKLQKKLQSSQLLRRSDQSPRLKGFKALSNLILREAGGSSQEPWGRGRGGDQLAAKARLQSSPLGTEPPRKIIKPKSFHKIQQEKLKEFGTADTAHMMTQNVEYLMQPSGSATDVVDNFSREAYSSQAAYYQASLPYGTHATFPDAQRRIPQVRRNTSTTHLVGANSRLAYPTGTSATPGGLHAAMYNTAAAYQTPVRSRLGQTTAPPAPGERARQLGSAAAKQEGLSTSIAYQL